jgi:antitoxin ParD1/3/4
MQIHLTKDQEDWLQAQVSAGRFSSLEEALAEAIDSLRAEDEALAWAKPLVDEGLAELNRGVSIPSEEVFASLEALLRKEG